MIYNESIQSVYVKIMWLLTVGLYICIPLGIGLISLLYNAILMVTLAVILLTVITNIVERGNTKLGSLQLLFMLLLGICVVFSLMQTEEESLTFSAHGMGILGFFEMVGSIYVVGFTKCTKDLKKFIFAVNLVISVVLIGFSFMPGIAYSGKLEDSLYLGFNNPNETAVYLMANICILMLFFDVLKRWLYKIPLLCVIAYLSYLLYCTNSRTALIATILVIVYQLFARKWRVPKWVIFVAVLFPVIFLQVYAYLFENHYFLDAEILDKPFYSGREDDFIRVLDNLKGEWLFGDAGKYHFTNLHNGPLSILASVGVMGYVTYLLSIFSTLRYYYNGIKTKSQTIALIAILAIFVHSSAEATFIVGGTHYSIIVATFYLLLRDDGEEEKTERVPFLRRSAWDELQRR